MLQATLLISSMMTTVCPPSAAEQSDLAAFKKADQVDDLYAGFEHLIEVDCSSNAGAWRWMGLRLAALIGPACPPDCR